jgi:hypothetical protein
MGCTVFHFLGKVSESVQYNDTHGASEYDTRLCGVISALNIILCALSRISLSRFFLKISRLYMRF